MAGGLARKGERGAFKAKPIAPPAPPRPAAPPPAPAPYSGGGGTSVGPFTSAPLAASSGGAAPQPPAPPAPPSITPEQDPTYLAQLAALQAALNNYGATYNNNVSNYNTSYGDALKNLGWSAAGKGAVDDPLTPNIDESKGRWNTSDQNTAAGRGYENQLNDFAGRGMLQSSYYATALNDLFRSLNDQRGSIDTAKTNYLQKLLSDKTDYTLQNKVSQQNARAEALARIAAGFTGS
jgi:hypothetical protein